MGRHKKPFSPFKKCHKCSTVKSLDDFYKDKTKGDGHCTVCKACDKAYHEANKAKRKAYAKAYREANKDYFAEHNHKYKAKKLGLPHVPFTPSEIFKRDNFTCRMCGKKHLKGRDLTIDHIFPISIGGLSHPENLQTLCGKCNRTKGSKMYFWSIPDEQEVM